MSTVNMQVSAHSKTAFTDLVNKISPDRAGDHHVRLTKDGSTLYVRGNSGSLGNFFTGIKDLFVGSDQRKKGLDTIKAALGAEYGVDVAQAAFENLGWKDKTSIKGSDLQKLQSEANLIANNFKTFKTAEKYLDQLISITTKAEASMGEIIGNVNKVVNTMFPMSDQDNMEIDDQDREVMMNAAQSGVVSLGRDELLKLNENLLKYPALQAMADVKKLDYNYSDDMQKRNCMLFMGGFTQAIASAVTSRLKDEVEAGNVLSTDYSPSDKGWRGVDYEKDSVLFDILTNKMKGTNIAISEDQNV